MADVFLSYKSEDRALIQTLARALEREGFTVWWDSKINAGRGWRETILRELRAAKAVVVAWSHRTEDLSAASWMLNEVDEAARLGVCVIPVMLERCEAPFGYRHVQAADLTNWRGDASHPEWREVLEAARAAVTGRRIGRVTPIRVRDVRLQRTSGGMSSTLLSVALLAAAFAGWRYVNGAQPPVAPPSTPAVAEAAPPPAAEERSTTRPWRARRAEDGAQVEMVSFVGSDGVRGAFRRTRGDLWVERNSEAGRAGFYHVNSASPAAIVLHDSERELHVRIDLEARVISIRNRGEERYYPRYRIVAVNGLDTP